MRKKNFGDKKIMKTCYIDRNEVKQDLVLEGMWIRRNSAGRSVNWYNHFG